MGCACGPSTATLPYVSTRLNPTLAPAIGLCMFVQQFCIDCSRDGVADEVCVLSLRNCSVHGRVVTAKYIRRSVPMLGRLSLTAIPSSLTHHPRTLRLASLASAEPNHHAQAAAGKVSGRPLT